MALTMTGSSIEAGPEWNWNGCEQYFDKVRDVKDEVY